MPTKPELVAAHGVRVLLHSSDRTEPDQITDLMEISSAASGGIDILVHNAGIPRDRAIDEIIFVP